MSKTVIFSLLFLFTFSIFSYAQFDLRPLEQMNLGNDWDDYSRPSKTIAEEREIPPEGIHCVQTGIDYG